MSSCIHRLLELCSPELMFIDSVDWPEYPVGSTPTPISVLYMKLWPSP